VPELPDVEGFRIALAAHLQGRRISGVHVADPGVLRNTSAQQFAAHLRDHRFRAPHRHGKWLLLPTDGPTLIVHSGMTGRPHVARRRDDHDRFERVRIELDRGEFRYDDMRKLRGLWLVDDDAGRDRVLGPVGPDALDLARPAFAAALDTRRRLKTALTDQETIAGLGNLLADEICWQAGVHPLRPCCSLDTERIGALHATMRRILRTSIRHRCVPSLRGWLTRVRAEPGARCPRDGTPLERTRLAGRTTVWCPQHQLD
jgi:formamidopyrimidine-DNA glycosylase